MTTKANTIPGPCHHPRSGGAAHPGAPARAGPGSACKSGVRGQARAARGDAQPAAPVGSLSESRILQSTGAAALDLRQARVIACGDDLVRHIALPRGCLPDVGAARSAQDYDPTCGTNDTRDPPSRSEFQGSLRPARRRPAAKISRPRRGDPQRSDGVREDSSCRMD